MGSGSYNGRVGRHGPVFSLDALQLSSIKPKTGCLCAVDGAALSHEMLGQAQDEAARICRMSIFADENAVRVGRRQSGVEFP